MGGESPSAEDTNAFNSCRNQWIAVLRAILEVRSREGFQPGVEVNYASIGSGGGITQVTKGLVDFGASDMPMTDQALSASPIKLVHIPTVLGAVVPIFNVPGVSDLKFSGDVLADIYAYLSSFPATKPGSQIPLLTTNTTLKPK